MIGKTLSNYSIIGTLGKGGMGTVYVAKDTRLGRTVALKVLPQELALDKSRRQRFTLEARSASQLKHPNVAHVYDVGEAEGVSFIVMEHVEGQTLADRISRGPVPIPEAVDIGSQIADALADAHALHITHRDIKPANVMLTDRGQVKVLDFGLARQGFDPEFTVDLLAETASPLTDRSQEVTLAGQILGTVPYMSPEQASGKSVTPQTDVFSLGVVLYEMISGQRPFDGTSPQDTLERIRRASPIELSKQNPKVPTALTRVVEKCLQAGLQTRYQNAGELLKDLRLISTQANAAPKTTKPPKTGQKIESIAVMPFENGSGDEEAGYLCDGLAENLIATLSQLSDVRVISRHATFALRDEPRDIQALGERLSVDALVLGDLRPRGDRIVANVELVGVPGGDRLWGERYDRPLNEAALVEHDVAEKVSQQIKEVLSSEEIERIQGNQVDPQAYLLYLKGRSLIVGNATQMEKGAEYLEEAARMDPSYALPHAALAESCMARANHGVMDVQEARQRARTAARTAVRLDPNLPEAHTALGIVSFIFDWDWEGADEAFRKAIEMGPGKDMPHLEYADYLAALDRLPEALKMAERTRELDPISPNPTHAVAYVHMLMGNYKKAIELFKEAIALHPNWIWGHIKLAAAYSRSNNHHSALAEVKIAEAALHDGGTPLAISWLGRVYAAAGKTAEALEILDKLKDKNGERLDPLPRVYIHSALGDKEKALECIEQAFRQRSALMPLVIQISYMEPQLELENEPRFRTILGGMGLPVPGGRGGRLTP